MSEKRIGLESNFQDRKKFEDKQRSIEGMIRSLESRRGLSREDQAKLNQLRNRLRGLIYENSSQG